MNAPRIVVIGAGVGGLAAAITLAAGGARVTVLERAHAAGGKIRSCSRTDLDLDVGPTVMTMAWVFADLFEAAGLDLHETLALSPLQTIAHHRWTDGSMLDLHAMEEESVAAVAEFAGAAAANDYVKFMRDAKRVFEQLDASFMTRPQAGLIGLLRNAGWRNLPGLLALSPFRSLWHDLSRSFADPRLRQLFARYSTYCGSSPLLAPATLKLIAHAEHTGVWRIAGGMRALGAALLRCAEKSGVRICLGVEAEEIRVRHDRTTGVRCSGGEDFRADSVVVNADTNALAAGCFGPAVQHAVAPTPVSTRSLSAVTFAGRARRTDADLHYHNVFFSADYAAEFAQLQAGRLPAQPTTYVCAPDFEKDCEQRLFVLVNAPPNGDSFRYSDALVASLRRDIEQQLERCGITLALSDFEATTPNDFATRYAATGGALYGPAMHGWRAAFCRPGNRTRCKALYVAGGSVHPGSGVPMAALSGQLCAAQVLADCDPARLQPVAHYRSRQHRAVS